MPPEEENDPEIRVSAGYANYVLGVLFVVYVFNFIDRQVLSILLTPIQEEIGVSDTQMGFLTGFAFVIFYTFAGIPIARFADRTSRSSVIAAGLVVWSIMTALSGLIQNFWQLAAARVGVGVGEAAGTPPAHSLISDYFPPERRATALSIYYIGVYIGVAMAFLGGGYLAANYGWRSVYIALGLTGIPLALLVRGTIRELPRGFSEPNAVVVKPIPFGEAGRQLLRNRSFVLIVLGTSIQSLSGYGIMTWGPTFFIRVHDMEMVDVGAQLGIAIGVAGSVGCLVGGWWADRAGRRDESWYMRLPALQALAAVPFALAFILFESQSLAMASFYPFYVVGAMYVGPMGAMIQGLVVPNMRATASAINLFVVNMIGLGLGPLVIGFLNDMLAPRFGDEGIRYSLLVMGAIGGFASIPFYLASRHLKEDLAAAREQARG